MYNFNKLLGHNQKFYANFVTKSCLLVFYPLPSTDNSWSSPCTFEVLSFCHIQWGGTSETSSGAQSVLRFVLGLDILGRRILIQH